MSNENGIQEQSAKQTSQKRMHGAAQFRAKGFSLGRVHRYVRVVAALEGRRPRPEDFCLVINTAPRKIE